MRKLGHGSGSTRVQDRTYASLTAVFPYILFNTIPLCHSQSGEEGEGMAVKEEEWRESTFYEG